MYDTAAGTKLAISQSCTFLEVRLVQNGGLKRARIVEFFYNRLIHENIKRIQFRLVMCNLV